MATFKLNPGAQSTAQAQLSEHVRIGAISVFALVIIISLAVLAVLSLSTANAALTLSQRQATAMDEMYLAETAAQEFVAGMDDVLAAARAGEVDAAEQSGTGSIVIRRDEYGNAVYDQNGFQVVEEQGESGSSIGEAGARAVEGALADLCAAARGATDDQVQVSASVTDNKVAAEFTCENGRTLHIVATVRNNGTYRIDKWKMSAVQNEEQPQGQLLILDE